MQMGFNLAVACDFLLRVLYSKLQCRAAISVERQITIELKTAPCEILSARLACTMFPFKEDVHLKNLPGAHAN